ncbi:MAG: hypothetical protein M1828_006665 [Chrysothrix sp. TS-e1954]|nr:MAG: hypothetical protein M1828_006665 [Chrysothrix sp. TS-e1954]
MLANSTRASSILDSDAGIGFQLDGSLQIAILDGFFGSTSSAANGKTFVRAFK